MAERYTLFQIEKLTDRFNLADGVPAGVKRNYNVSPTQLGAVIINRDGNNVLERMKWGFIPSTAKDSNSVHRYKTYLAKSEGIFSKPTWEDAINHSRCLIPANGYYEWQKTPDGKLPFYIRPRAQELFSFAGIYSSWIDPDGKEWGTFAIVTALHDRGPKMPLQRPIILGIDDETEWLNAKDMDINVLFSLARPLAEEHLLIHQVSSDIKNMKINDPRLMHQVR